MSLFDTAKNYTQAEVARIMFGWTAGTFSQRKARMMREEGFPKPVSKFGRPRWAGARLNAWHDRDATLQGPITLSANVESIGDYLKTSGAAIAKGNRA